LEQLRKQNNNGFFENAVTYFTITVTTPGFSGSFTETGIVDDPTVSNMTMDFHYSGASNAACGGP